MTQAQNLLKEALARKATSVVIEGEDKQGKQQKITVIKLDQPQDDEEVDGVISVRIKDKNDKGLFKNLGVDRFPSCDYLYICPMQEKQGSTNFYLIEQIDLGKTLARATGKDTDSTPGKNKILAGVVERIKDIETSFNQEKVVVSSTNGDKTVDPKNFSKLIRDITTYGVVERCRRKFYSSLAVLFHLQTREDLMDLFSTSQTYSFVLLDIPPEGGAGGLGVGFRRMINRQLKNKLDWQGKIEEQEKTKERGKVEKSGRTIQIGKFLDGFGELKKEVGPTASATD